jgi:hypothetical protein
VVVRECLKTNLKAEFEKALPRNEQRYLPALTIIFTAVSLFAVQAQHLPKGAVGVVIVFVSFVILISFESSLRRFATAWRYRQWSVAAEAGFWCSNASLSAGFIFGMLCGSLEIGFAVVLSLWFTAYLTLGCPFVKIVESERHV